MYQYRAYVKDVLDLKGKPKAFLNIVSFTIKRDLLTTSNSSFTVLQIPSNIDNGDIICVYDPYGKVIYQGVINQIADNVINTNQIQSIYKGLWLCKNSPQDYLEHEVAVLLEEYASGKITDDVMDYLQAQKLTSIDIEYEGSNANQLQSFDAQQTQDMETFIYRLYEKYNIILDFAINWEGNNSVMIHTADFTPYKIANNTHAIIDISPTTEISQNNKLIVYSSEGAYRAVYYATPQGIVTNSQDPLRLKNINTIIQFTDDDINAVIASNLNEEMYNHKLTFTLRIDNKLYKWDDFKLGQPMDIYFNGQYFKSVFTGYEMALAQDQSIDEVKITCGKVRTSLTSKLLLGGSR